MPHEGSVTALIRLAGKDDRADHELWQRYFQRLVGLARRKLGEGQRQVADEEDVVVSVFDSFLQGARDQRFRQLENRDDLWQILVMLTARKAANQKKMLLRQKRGAGRVRGGSVFEAPGSSSRAAGMATVVGAEPTPDFAAQVVEEMRNLLVGLADQTLRTIAISKMQGYTNAEIADRLGCKERTIERKLQRIRQKWQDLA
jgi:DNA-directed RNA polymerase specialized sigma24 family protein